MKNIRWTKFWTRNFGLFRYYVYIESNKLPFYRKNFGKVFDYAITAPDGKLTAYYHDRAELADMTQRIYQTSCKNSKTFEKYSRTILGWMREFIKFNREMKAVSLAKISNRQISKLFEQWYSKYLLWQTGIYFYFTLEPIITEKFVAGLQDYLQHTGREKLFAGFSATVMSPEKMNAVTLEHLSALQTALKMKRGHKQSLQAHYQKFLWLPCYDIHHQGFDLAHFEEEINKLEKIPAPKLRKEIKDITADFSRRGPRFRKTLAKIKGSKLRELCKIMHSLVYYKDLRDDLRRQASFAGKTFMSALAKRFNLTLEEINYLTPPEVRGLFAGKIISKQKIRARIPTNYLLKSSPGKIQIFEGTAAKKMLAAELTINQEKKQGSIKGLVACRGAATGKVRIVRHSVALERVKFGDILVALTTHPEYLPAMKKAAAFITDEGGLTSHAAIVARELNKPCIVGTKTATHVLKDGDKVRVDANNGIVVKLN